MLENLIHLIFVEEFLVLLLVSDTPMSKWMFSDAVLSQWFFCSIWWSFYFFTASTLPLNWAFGSETTMSAVQISRAFNADPRIVPGKTFPPNWCSLDWSFAEIKWFSTIVPNDITRPLKGIPNRLSHGVEILNVLQKAVAFHAIRPPFVSHTRLQ